MTEARITVNGRQASIAPAPAHTTVLDFLRERGLTGTKEGCAEGECGACSVLVARPGVHKPTDWVAVNACLVPVAALDGQEVSPAPGPVPEPAPEPEPAPVAVPPALVAHARKVADDYRARTGYPIDADTLRSRLGVPPLMAAAIAAQLT
ncbi:hypothetical protein EAO70_08965 [Streptomyces sp. adm13(2018)]|uniref:2Fe-2S iron-sulfur cluster-binding protein n=1 Tax=Streptomyces sp. adm13(2018) TaxID=2479007 RepID=UPI0011CE4554|nr:hypothetical protein EAO70_08965 [Streptomyces sp. adm13(2018)]